VPVTTIRDWPTHGEGPCAIKVGGTGPVSVSDVLAWLARQRELAWPQPLGDRRSLHSADVLLDSGEAAH
jgi:hypothetical protein